MIKLENFIYLSISLYLFCFNAKAWAAQNSQKPNILFVLADDLGYMDIGAYASHVTKEDKRKFWYETPTLDKLTENGAMFTQAYACSLCSPSRSSLITGKYAAEHGFMTATPGNYATYYNQAKEVPPGMYKNDGIMPKHDRPFWPLVQGITNISLPKDEITIAEALTGYDNAFIGKWHLGGHGTVGESPAHHGFKELAWFDAGGSDYFNWEKKWNGGHKYHKTMPQEKAFRGNAGNLSGEEYLTDDLTIQANEYIKKQANNKDPFFLYFCQFAVHSPFQAKKEMVQHFAKKPNRGYHDHNNATYAAMLKSLDESMELVIKTLQETKQLDNTIIIFMSDNGGIVKPGPDGKPKISNNSPLKGEKALLYEGGIRVPLIIYNHKRIKPQIIDRPVDCNDIFPTIMDLTDTKVSHKIDGQSILPLIEGVETDQVYNRKAYYWHYPFYVDVGLKHGELTSPRSAIRDGDWKLIIDWEGKLELYNIEDDITEKNNLAQQEPEKLQMLFTKLIQWIDENVESRYIPRENTQYKSDHKDARSISDIFSNYQVSKPKGKSRVE